MRVIVILIAAVFALSAPAFAGTISEDFNTTASNWQFNGSAFQYLNDGVAVLTTQGYGQSGSIFYKTPVRIDKMIVSFDFFTGYDPNGADGITFCVLDSAYSPYTAIGGGGNGLGYANIGYGGAVEFDTWYNGEFNDPNGNHVGIDRDGNPVSYAVNPNIPQLEVDRIHHAEIDFDSGHFLVKLDGANVLDYTMPGVQPIDAYVGFTGSTGGAYNYQFIDNFNLRTEDQGPTVPEPASMMLLGLGVAGFLGSRRRTRKEVM